MSPTERRPPPLIAALLVLLILVQIALYALTLRNTREQAQDSADTQLQTTAHLVEQLLELRSWQQARSVSTLAADYDLHKAIASGDRTAISTLLRSHARQLQASFMVLSSHDRQLLVSLPADLPTGDLNAILKTAAAMANKTGTLPIDLLRSENGTLYQMQRGALNIPVVNAELTLGFALDDSLASALKQMTGSELVLVSRGENGAWQQHASTLDVTPASLLGSPSALDNGADWTLRNGERSYQMHSMRLGNVRLQSAGEVLLMVGKAERPLLQIEDWGEPLRHLLPLLGMLLTLLVLLLLQPRWANLRKRREKDSLTGLGTWQNFASRIGLALIKDGQTPKPLALLLIRLEGLQRIADTQQIDALIRETAHRLRSQLQRGSSLARLNQDTFALLLPDCDRAQAIRQAQTLEQALTQPISAAGNRLLPAISTGIAVAPQDGNSAEELLEMARTEMAAGNDVPLA